MENGDYILATKYHDGDPKDPFHIGFFGGMLHERFMVVGSDGVSVRASGFRRAEKISERVGRILVENIKLIEQSSCSVWYWRRNVKKLECISKMLNS